MRNHAVLFIALGMALAVPAGFAQQQPNTSIRHLVPGNVKKDRLLDAAIERVARAFERGDPDELEDSLVSPRVYLSLKSGGDEAAYYSRSQAKFMFAKLFQDRETEAFRYDPMDVDDSGAGVASFRADWSYIAPDQDEIVTERLRFKLERGKNDWKVTEIRAQVN